MSAGLYMMCVDSFRCLVIACEIAVYPILVAFPHLQQCIKVMEDQKHIFSRLTFSSMVIMQNST